MKKKQIIIAGISLALVVAVVLVVIFVLPGLKEEPENTMPLKVHLDLEFESEDDLKWMQIHTLDGPLPENSQNVIQDGYLHLSADNRLGNINMIYGMESHRFFHMRTRSSGQICDSIGMEVGLNDQAKAMGIEGCVNSLYNISAVYNRDHFGDSVFASVPITGSVPNFENEWIDRIVWVNENRDAVFFVVSNSSDPDFVMYGSVALPEDWQYDRWTPGAGVNYGEVMDSSQYMDVDFIRTGSGMLKDYLEEYVPAYKENKDELDAFLERPAPPMSELLPPPDGGGGEQEQEQENNSEMGEAEQAEQEPMEQSSEPVEVQPTWDGVLTWPDPEPVIPYLATQEDLTYCPNCEIAAYGVNMAPAGYIFSVSYRPVQGTTSEYVNPGIEQWVQLYDHPITTGEVVHSYRMFSRVKQNGRNEPFQVLYNGAETNLMLTKSNILINSSAVDTRDNYSTGLELIDLTASQISEEGIPIPDLVEAPSTAINNDYADEVLEAVWVGHDDNPSVPVFEMNDRTHFYFQLKTEVEKIEYAVYHPESQTYLSYFWMDNPAEGEAIRIDRRFSNSVNRNVNGYYLEYFEGTFLIRVWVDGELVSEFEVEG